MSTLGYFGAALWILILVALLGSRKVTISGWEATNPVLKLIYGIAGFSVMMLVFCALGYVGQLMLAPILDLWVLL